MCIVIMMWDKATYSMYRAYSPVWSVWQTAQNTMKAEIREGLAKTSPKKGDLSSTLWA